MSSFPDQTGRVFVVTGANSGLGAATARALDAAGATVVLACRDVAKAEHVASQLSDRAQVRSLDLADPASIAAFAAAQTDPVDVLINNAGIMGPPLLRTVEGFELQFGTNHLGHFALTGLLLDKISDRVVTISSMAHRWGSLNFTDPNYEHRRYVAPQAYGQSKLANLVFALELQRRLTAAGSAVRSVAAHPGIAVTGLTGFGGPGVRLAFRVFGTSAENGAKPQLYAATAAVAPGGYYGPALLPFGRRVVQAGPSRAARKASAGTALWELSEKLTGVSYLSAAGQSAANASEET